MTTDRYTKVILTIIAMSLSVIAIQLTIKDANAQSFSRDGIQRVAICNQQIKNGVYWCADIVNGGQVRVSQE